MGFSLEVCLHIHVLSQNKTLSPSSQWPKGHIWFSSPVCLFYSFGQSSRGLQVCLLFLKQASTVPCLGLLHSVFPLP
jgi:hypothetical protein